MHQIRPGLWFMCASFSTFATPALGSVCGSKGSHRSAGGKVTAAGSVNLEISLWERTAIAVALPADLTGSLILTESESSGWRTCKNQLVLQSVSSGSTLKGSYGHTV
jgi:hypothetical protein